jgi:hypothetical protein
MATKKPRPKFRRGMKVKRILHLPGTKSEVTEVEVERVKDGVVYLTEGPGITYSAETGMEIERFFLPMYAEIQPIPPAGP